MGGRGRVPDPRSEALRAGALQPSDVVLNMGMGSHVMSRSDRLAIAVGVDVVTPRAESVSVHPAEEVRTCADRRTCPDSEIRRDGLIDEIEELAELSGSVSCSELMDHHAGSQVQRREQVDGTRGT